MCFFCASDGDGVRFLIAYHYCPVNVFVNCFKLRYFNRLRKKMIVFDLKSVSSFGQTSDYFSERLANEQGSIDLLATNGFLSKKRIQQVYSPSSRRPSHQDILLSRPISLHGFCTAYFSRVTTRHRDLSASGPAPTIPRWVQRQSRTQHTGRRKREASVADICRLRTSPDTESEVPVSQGELRRGIRANRLRARFNHYRFVAHTVPMGSISKEKERCEATHANRHERLDSVLYTRNQWQSRGCKNHRSPEHRAWRILHHGSRLPRLRKTISLFKEPGLFRDTGQEETCLYSTILPTYRQNDRPEKRSDHQANRAEIFTALSGNTQTHQFLRCRYEQAVYLSDKQLCSRCPDCHTTLQVSLADRTVLQMDQAAPANQRLLRHLTECRQDPDMDSCKRLYRCCYHEEGTRIKAEFVRNPANSQHYTFSERPYKTSTYEHKYAKPICRKP
jgi:hypothetical protein